MTALLQQRYTTDEAAPLALELIVVGCNATRLQEYVAALRNAGLAAHGERASNVGQLQKRLSVDSYDIVFIDTGSGLDVDAAAAELQTALADSVLFLLAAQPSSWLGAAAKLGAADVIAPTDLERLTFAVRRELDALQVRRILARTRAQVQEAEARSNALIESSPEAVAYVHEGMHVHANSSYARTFGFGETSELEGLTLMDLVAPEHREAARRVLREAEEDKATDAVELCFLGADDQSFAATLACSRASVDGEPCIQVVVRPRGSVAAAPQPVPSRAERDILTGLLTRQSFCKDLEQALRNHGSEDPPLVLGLLALSNFPSLQEAFGRPATEALLHDTANALTPYLRGTVASAGRFADHTLAFLTDATDDPEALARDCLMALPHEIANSDRAELRPNHGIGLAVLEAAAFGDVDAWTKAAGEALERAERDSPGGIAFYQPSPSVSGNEAATELAGLIDEVLKQERLQLLYQPIVSLHGDAREHYAVLPRILDPSGAAIADDCYAGQTGPAEKLAEIDRWVIRNSISELAKQRKDGRKVVFFLPLSRAAVESDAILLWVCDCLREFQAKGAWLVFQFREADLQTMLDPVRQLIEGLRKINCRVAVDQLSDSAHTLELLEQLRVDAVKLAPEFMQDLADDPARQERLRAVHEHLSGLELKTVVTAVEDANSLAVLWSTGVHFIQGDFLQEATPSLVSCEIGQQ